MDDVYKRRTGKMSMKEARNIAAKNKSMTDWVRKVSTPTRSIVSDIEHGALEKWSGRMQLQKRRQSRAGGGS